jgi:hypothetical protein
MNPAAHPGLLVSVRNSAEAQSALAGGADLVDIKEPNAGALGRATRDAMQEVVDGVRERVPVSAALGELAEWSDASCAIPAGICYAKLGLASCATDSGWANTWRAAMSGLPSGVAPVAVVYADWRIAEAPSPSEVLRQVESTSCRIVLVDTWSKASGGLLEHWTQGEVRQFVRERRAVDQAVVLAGSLSLDQIVALADVRPNYFAVRGAACESGRSSAICRDKVGRLRAAIDSGCARVSRPRTLI